MKDGWERTAPAERLTPQQVQALVASVWPQAVVLSARPIGTGLSNSLYRVDVAHPSEAVYALRIYRNSPAVLRKESDIARLLQQEGAVPIAPMVYEDGSGRLLPRPWGLMEWRTGITLKELLRQGSLAEAEQAAAEAGATLARIHQHSFPEPGFFGPGLSVAEPLRMDPGMFLSLVEHWLFRGTAGTLLPPELRERLWGFCRTHAPRLSDHPERAVLVHSDYNELNVLMNVLPSDGRASVSAVLDWEFAFAGDPMVDVGNMLRYEPAGSLFENKFMEGYLREGGVLTEAWRLRAHLADVVALLDLLDGAAEAPNRKKDLILLLGSTLRTYL
ncbi:phosphotransferase [Paenibacillus filicis]|uniref:Phosphotransferase n=1 Tax=Paenibacillus gyeongsangnamensis TaxID=3388067 RepID=A0ABT4QFR4_9BACL|nr:phosphotransferase [Paenibacillus filicis]MCZ8515699.1 phosphotransferase [Paenibacillus filicis]